MQRRARRQALTPHPHPSQTHTCTRWEQENARNGEIGKRKKTNGGKKKRVQERNIGQTRRSKVALRGVTLLLRQCINRLVTYPAQDNQRHPHSARHIDRTLLTTLTTHHGGARRDTERRSVTALLVSFLGREHSRLPMFHQSKKSASAHLSRRCIVSTPPCVLLFLRLVLLVVPASCD